MPREFRDKNSNGRKEKKNMTCVRVCVGGGGGSCFNPVRMRTEEESRFNKDKRHKVFVWFFFFLGRTLLLLAGRSMAGIPSSRLRR